MKLVVVLVLAILPGLANAFTVLCPGKIMPDQTFEIETSEDVTENRTQFVFPENAAVNVVEKDKYLIRNYSGHLILQQHGPLTKHGRMAYYLFELKDSRARIFHTQHLVLEIFGIDVGPEEKYKCHWF